MTIDDVKLLIIDVTSHLEEQLNYIQLGNLSKDEKISNLEAKIETLENIISGGLKK